MKTIDSTVLDALTKQARESPRKRAHFNLHPELNDPVQRLCVAIEPDTYIRPHRHMDPVTNELFLMLRGSAVLLFFDDYGRVVELITLSSQGPVMAAEIPAGTWHTMASLETGSVFFEVKQGPYAPPATKNVASWAPAEGKPGTEQLLTWYKAAKAGDIPPKV